MAHTARRTLSATRSHALQQALDHFHTSGSRWSLVYKTRPDWPSIPSSDTRGTVSILDSSFNPPTLAHAALASLPTSGTRTSHAHLLVFSVRNADKGRGRPGDATPLQRLEMMELLAYHLESQSLNVAIALVDEPLVFAKATLFHQHIPSHVPLHLYWIMGSDTLTRVFDPKYYGSEAHLAESCRRFFEQDTSHILCSERSDDSVQGTMTATAPTTVAHSPDVHILLQRPGPAHDWYQRGSIELQSIDPILGQCSSTAARRSVLQAYQNDISRDEQSQILARIVPPLLVEYIVSHSLYHARP